MVARYAGIPIPRMDAFRAAILWIGFPGEHAVEMAFTFRAMSLLHATKALISGQQFFGH